MESYVYDIWYWGSTRVFRPLKAEICRKRYHKKANGDIIVNSRFPQPDRPRIEIKEIEYSDLDTTKLTKLWDSSGLEINGNLNDWKFGKVKKENNKYSKLSKPGLYIPRIYKEPGTNKIFYPIGMVAIEENTDKKSNKIKKTILVSGDVIIPDLFKLSYIDKKDRSVKKGGKGFHEGTHQGIFLQVDTTHKDYQILGDLFMNIDPINTAEKNKEKELLNNKYKNSVLRNNYNIVNDFEQNDDLSYYEVMNYLGYKNKNKEYWGIVGIPKICLDEIKINKNTVNNKPIFSTFQHHNYCEGTKLLRVQKKLKREYGCDRKPDKTNHLYSFNIIDAMESKNPKETYNIVRAFNKGKNNVESRRLNTIWDNNYKNQSFFIIKEKFTKPAYDITKIPDKELNDEYNFLGMGWFGHPSKAERKYSIFSYLGLIPEGIIIHRASSRKFYIRHYGGMDMNKFVIYLWNENEKEYNKAIKVQSDDNVQFSALQATDQRFQFEMVVDEKDKNIIRFRSIYLPDYYLHINYTFESNINLIDNKQDNKLGALRPKGITISHTKPILKLTKNAGTLNNTKNQVLFLLQPVYGTQQYILEEKNAKPVFNSSNFDKDINNRYIYKDVEKPVNIKNINSPNSNLYYSK